MGYRLSEYRCYSDRETIVLDIDEWLNEMKSIVLIDEETKEKNRKIINKMNTLLKIRRKYER